jgi:hypothetical protein
MVREKVAAFGEPGNVPISLAQDLIKASAFWVDHPQGIIHPEPGWSDRIVTGPHGWEVKFGDYFLVERAIILSKRTILEELDHAQKSSQPIDRRVLYGRLITCVRKSVADWSHQLVDYYTGGASPELKREIYYTADSMLPRAPEGKISLIGPDTKRYGSTPPSNDVWKGFMKFGVHAIQVEGFVERIWQVAGLETVE